MKILELKHASSAPDDKTPSLAVQHSAAHRGFLLAVLAASATAMGQHQERRTSHLF